MVFLQSKRTKPRDYQNVGFVYHFQVEIKHHVNTQRSIVRPLIKAILPFESLHRILFSTLTHRAVISHNSLASCPTKHKLSPEVLSFPMATSQSPTQQTITGIPTRLPFSNSKGYHCSQPPRTVLIIIYEKETATEIKLLSVLNLK